jgi:hypothetical protein
LGTVVELGLEESFVGAQLGQLAAMLGSVRVRVVPIVRGRLFLTLAARYERGNGQQCNQFVHEFSFSDS